MAVTDWGGVNYRFLGLVSVGAARSLDQTVLRPSVIKIIRHIHAKCTCGKNGNVHENDQKEKKKGDLVKIIWYPLKMIP